MGIVIGRECSFRTTQTLNFTVQKGLPMMFFNEQVAEGIFMNMGTQI